MSIDRDKVLVADAAFDFPLHNLPRECAVVLRYIGREGETPHIVDQAAIDHIRGSGFAFAPIWTPTNRVFSQQLGAQAAGEMVAALGRYKLLGTEPVFLDIEEHVYAADPHGCMAGVEAWQRGMHAAHHVQAYAYLPGAAATQWVADWVGQAPHHFAPGVIGVQYVGSGPSHGQYDLSVFARTVFAPLLDHRRTAPPKAGTDQQWLVDQLARVQSNLAKLIRAESADVQGVVKAGAVGNVNALADAIVTKLGPRLAGDLAAELAQRLAR